MLFYCLELAKSMNGIFYLNCRSCDYINCAQKSSILKPSHYDKNINGDRRTSVSSISVPMYVYLIGQNFSSYFPIGQSCSCSTRTGSDCTGCLSGKY